MYYIALHSASQGVSVMGMAPYPPAIPRLREGSQRTFSAEVFGLEYSKKIDEWILTDRVIDVEVDEVDRWKSGEN